MRRSDISPVHRVDKSRVICVLGMHRTGTSCLVGTLEQGGVFLGEVATHNTFNVKGNRENAAIRSVNGQVLHDNGGDWNRPPVPPVVWQTAHCETRDAIIRSYAGQPVWGFKDPRTLLTLEGWLEALPGMEFIGVVRHPLSVARSLRDRPRGPMLEEGVRLWTIYNARLLDYWERFKFPIVSFDSSAGRLQASLADVTRGLQLPDPPEEPGAQFFDPGLKHQPVPDKDDPDAGLLDGATVALYERLSAIAF